MFCMPSLAEFLFDVDDAKANETPHRDYADCYWLIGAMGSVDWILQFTRLVMPAHKVRRRVCI